LNSRKPVEFEIEHETFDVTDDSIAWAEKSLNKSLELPLKRKQEGAD
jgi:hypothetical protein